MYVTPRRFRKMGLGVNLTGVPDHELRDQLQTASIAVDAYCNVPLYPQRHSFLGGTITGEQKSWTDNYARRIYPLHYPLRSVESIRIDATNNLFIEFEPDDYYVQTLEGYVEIINFALSRVGIWGAGNVPALGLSVPTAILDYTYGRHYTVVDELLSEASESGEEDDTVYMGVSGFWDPDEDVTIKVDGVVTTTGFTLDRASGFVTFNSAETGEVTASYVYRCPWEVQRATALGAVTFLGESKLIAKGMTGIESIEVEEVRLRRIGSRSGAEKGIALPGVAQSLLDGLVFQTLRG